MNNLNLSAINHEIENRAESNSFNTFIILSNELQENTVILHLEFDFYDALLYIYNFSKLRKLGVNLAQGVSNGNLKQPKLQKIA